MRYQYGATRMQHRPSLLDALLKRKEQVQPIKAIEPVSFASDLSINEHDALVADFQNSYESVVEKDSPHKRAALSGEQLSNIALKKWALTYLRGIPDQYKLPGDIKLLREINSLEDHFLPEELQKKLQWIRTLTEGNILAKLGSK